MIPVHVQFDSSLGSIQFGSKLVLVPVWFWFDSSLVLVDSTLVPRSTSLALLGFHFGSGLVPIWFRFGAGLVTACFWFQFGYDLAPV